MRNTTLRDIVQITGGKLVIMGAPEDKVKLLNLQEQVLLRSVNDLCIDSRRIKQGDLFIPLKGNSVDAHAYIPEVMSGAVAALSNREISDVYNNSSAYFSGEKRHDIIIQVNNTQTALEQIGSYGRSLYGSPVIGVTGSVGKTTTRCMIATALRSEKAVFETQGNLNSHIGIPLMTSRMNDVNTDIAVLEMGIDRIGEMDTEVSIVRPDLAVVTNIGVSHLEHFGTQDILKREKLKVASKNTVLFLNADDALLRGLKSHEITSETHYFGTSPDVEYRAENITQSEKEMHFMYCHNKKQIPVRIPVLGEHNVICAMAALSICDYLGMDIRKAADALANYEPVRQVTKRTKEGAVLIDDVYNASPDSMKAALRVLSNYPVTGRRFAVLGDMLELGSREGELHSEVGVFFDQICVDELVVVGQLATIIAEHGSKACPLMHVKVCDSLEDATDYLRDRVLPEDVVLLKASHGMSFDKILNWLL